MEKKQSSPEKTTVSSTEKALRILDCFTAERPELNLAQISQQLNMPKSTVLNQIRTLEKAGFLYKSNTQYYRLGYKLIELSYRTQVSQPIIAHAVPLLEEITTATGENVYLTTHINGQVFVLKLLRSSNRSIAYSMSGRTLPMHCTGCGKAMLSYLPQEQVDDILNTWGMPAYTANTCTDRAKLMEELAQAREQGYALDNEEESIGGRCVAVAVRSSAGAVAGALSISGSVVSLTDDKIPEYVNMLRITAHKLMPYAHLFPALQLKEV